MDAVSWNKERLNQEDILPIQVVLNENGHGVARDGILGPDTVRGIKEFQRSIGLTADGKVGPWTLKVFRVALGEREEEVHLDVDRRRKVMSRTVAREKAGYANPFVAINKDYEYKGSFDKKADDGSFRYIHRASKRGATPFHVGISFGCIQFAQQPGSLSGLLERCREYDKDLFDRIMGGKAVAKQLLRIVGASSKRIRAGSPFTHNTMPVDGDVLWEEPWLSRFTELGEQEVFQKAQLDQAGERYLQPAVEYCKAIGCLTDPMLAVVFDICVQHGKGGCRRYLKRAFGKRTDVKQREIFKLIKKLPSVNRRRRCKVLRDVDEAVVYCYV